MSHPARFSPEIIEAFAVLLYGLVPAGGRIHDCYGGDGRRIGALADKLHLTLTGTELEAPYIKDNRIVQGDATDPTTYPTDPFWIVTSPVYPNGIADHFRPTGVCSACRGTGEQLDLDGGGAGPAPCAKCGGAGTREVRRKTYRTWLAEVLGHDQPLHPNNMGRWGYRGRNVTSPARRMYWSLARRTVDAWADSAAIGALVNVSDFVAGNKTTPVVEPWCDIITAAGFRVVEVVDVSTQRYRDGANRDARVDFEAIIVALRPGV